MCEAAFRDMLEKNGMDQEVSCSSAGISAIPEPASFNARKAVEEAGLSLDAHTARQFTRELAEDADWIVAVSPSHYNAILRIAPEAEAKAGLLCSTGISDPFGGDLSVYRACFAEIRNALKELFKTIIIQKG